MKGKPHDDSDPPPQIFRLPLFPKHDSEEKDEEEGEVAAPPEGLIPFNVDYETEYEQAANEDDETKIEDSPAPGHDWTIIPLLPEVPVSLTPLTHSNVQARILKHF